MRECGIVCIKMTVTFGIRHNNSLIMDIDGTTYLSVNYSVFTQLRPKGWYRLLLVFSLCVGHQLIINILGLFVNIFYSYTPDRW